MVRTNSQHTVVIMTDQDIRFRSVVRDIKMQADGNELGFASHNGLSYLVVRINLPGFPSKTWYGKTHGPDVTKEYTEQFMADFLRKE